MKIEKALELAIKTLDATADNINERTTHDSENYKEDLRDILNLSEAIKVLRYGEQPVKVVEEYDQYKCDRCFGDKNTCCCTQEKGKMIKTKMRETYTTTRRLTIETVESEPVFEEIDE